MRVISGKYRGRKLAIFEGKDIRPTADRVKESLFNILSAQIADAVVLDMFCGSGSLGIECLSRGAKFVQFNDISKDSLALLKKNLHGIADGYKISNCDYLNCVKPSDRFDIIFIDPPYALEYGNTALKLAAEVLNPNGVAVYERDRPFEGDVEGLEKVDERKYGKTYLSFFKTV